MQCRKHMLWDVRILIGIHLHSMDCDWHSLLVCDVTAELRGDWHMHVLEARFLLAYTPWPVEVSRFHTMYDSESQKKHTQLPQKNTPNASDGDVNANELSEKQIKAAMFLEHNPSPEIMLIQNPSLWSYSKEIQCLAMKSSPKN